MGKLIIEHKQGIWYVHALGQTHKGLGLETALGKMAPNAPVEYVYGAASILEDFVPWEGKTIHEGVQSS